MKSRYEVEYTWIDGNATQRAAAARMLRVRDAPGIDCELWRTIRRISDGAEKKCGLCVVNEDLAVMDTDGLAMRFKTLEEAKAFALDRAQRANANAIIDVRLEWTDCEGKLQGMNTRRPLAATSIGYVFFEGGHIYYDSDAFDTKTIVPFVGYGVMSGMMRNFVFHDLDKAKAYAEQQYRRWFNSNMKKMEEG